MSSYNNFIGKLASDQQNSNMQRHMGTMTDNISSTRQRILQNIINYEYSQFTRLIYETALGRHERYYEGKQLNNYLLNNENDLIPIFSTMNEDVLNDPEFSKALVNKTLYTKELAKEEDHILFYIPKKAGSICHDIYMKLLYVPSQSPDKPNAMRLEAGEQLLENREYPYITFSVDIGDDGSITYNEPIMVEKRVRNDKEEIIYTPSDMSYARLYFSDKGVQAVRDTLMTVFEKAGIKEETSNKKH